MSKMSFSDDVDSLTFGLTFTISIPGLSSESFSRKQENLFRVDVARSLGFSESEMDCVNIEDVGESIRVYMVVHKSTKEEAKDASTFLFQRKQKTLDIGGYAACTLYIQGIKPSQLKSTTSSSSSFKFENEIENNSSFKFEDEEEDGASFIFEKEIDDKDAEEGEREVRRKPKPVRKTPEWLKTTTSLIATSVTKSFTVFSSSKDFFRKSREEHEKKLEAQKLKDEEAKVVAQVMADHIGYKPNHANEVNVADFWYVPDNVAIQIAIWRVQQKRKLELKQKDKLPYSAHEQAKPKLGTSYAAADGSALGVAM